MSIKLNVIKIISEHYKTLINAQTNRLSKIDLFTFLLIPISVAFLAAIVNFNISADFRTACINFGAIFSALLMSVLVLVYDQENKLQNLTDYNLDDKKTLLNQLYHNICFTIVCALNCVIFCLLHIVFSSGVFKSEFINVFFMSPIIIFFLVSLILTTFMIIKRLHALLTAL